MFIPGDPRRALLYKAGVGMRKRKIDRPPERQCDPDPGLDAMRRAAGRQ
jgi:hypothetical protein